MKEPMGPSPARQRNAPQTQHKTSKCESATAEHFSTLFTPAAAARGSDPEKLSIVPTPRPNPRPPSRPPAAAQGHREATAGQGQGPAPPAAVLAGALPSPLRSVSTETTRPCPSVPSPFYLTNPIWWSFTISLQVLTLAPRSLSLLSPFTCPFSTLSPLSLLVSPSPSPSLVPSPRNVSLPSPGSLLIRLSLRSSASPAASVSTSLPPLTHVHSPSRGVTAWPRWAAYLFTQSKRDGSKFQWNMERLAESLYLPKLGYVP